MCDRGFHGSSSSSSTLGARGLYLSKLKEVRTPPGTMQLKNVSRLGLRFLAFLC